MEYQWLIAVVDIRNAVLFLLQIILADPEAKRSVMPMACKSWGGESVLVSDPRISLSLARTQSAFAGQNRWQRLDLSVYNSAIWLAASAGFLNLFIYSFVYHLSPLSIYLILFSSFTSFIPSTFSYCYLTLYLSAILTFHLYFLFFSSLLFPPSFFNSFSVRCPFLCFIISYIS
jgi:hypothetical protein